jgi:hypothetical protein
MSTSKYIIILISLLLFPLLAEAQIYRTPTKNEAKQIGRKIYVISTGDTTRVVNPTSGGLTDEYSKFLFIKNHNAAVDSIFGETNPTYSGLEEAALDVDELLREIEAEKRINNERNDALGFRLARDYRNRKKKERAAMNIADSLMKKDASIQELTNMYIGFNGKPTYYINGLEVSFSVTNQLYPSEVIKREMRVTDTASGNPFGEVWYLVSEKTLDRLKIPIDLTNDYLFNNNVASTAATVPVNSAAEVKKKAPKAPEPVIRREITADGKQVDRVVKTEETDMPEEKSTTESTTRIISRTVNDEKVGTDENATYIINRPGIKRVANPPQSTIRQQHYNNSSNTTTTNNATNKDEPAKVEEKKQENNTPKTVPKKSVRRIKERLQNQYKDE